MDIVREENPRHAIKSHRVAVWNAVYYIPVGRIITAFLNACWAVRMWRRRALLLERAVRYGTVSIRKEGLNYIVTIKGVGSAHSGVASSLEEAIELVSGEEP